MAVDLGSEFIKVAIVKPGIPMEIVLDDDSSRKTSTIVGLRNSERVFGSSAVTMNLKFPTYTFPFVVQLIGKSINDSEVQHLLKNFRHLSLEENDGKLYYLHPDLIVNVEDVMSMLLEKARLTAEKNSGFPIKSAVLIIPSFFSQASRRALLRSAELSGLSTPQLINSDAAVGLNFGVFRYKQFSEDSKLFMFFDFGFSKCIVSVLQYRVVKTIPQFIVIGLGYDSTLGTSLLAMRLRDFLAEQFDKKAGLKSTNSVTLNPRAMNKLFIESLRVIRILSANMETNAQIENLMNEIDLKISISRNDFENLCSDLISRITGAINRSISSVDISPSDIEEVLLMGGGSRIPFVQQAILQSVGKTELGKSINSDEAAALGGVYQAAHLTPGFKVKQFDVKQANLDAIQVSFHKADGTDIVTRTLFVNLAHYPQRKILTFNKHTDDFDFLIHYNNETSKKLNNKIARVKVHGVKAAFEKHLQPLKSISSEEDTENNSIKIEPTGIKAHFELDFNGLVTIRYIEAIFEKSPAALELESKLKQKSTLSKLGEKITSFFGSGTSSQVNDTQPDLEPQKGVPQNVSMNDTLQDNKINTTLVNSTEIKANVSKIVTEVLMFNLEYLDFNEPTTQQKEESAKFLKDLRESDRKKFEYEKAKNDLESFIFEMLDKFSTSDEYIACSTEEERKEIVSTLSELRDWYDEQSSDVPREEFVNALKKLQALTKDTQYRVKEMDARKEAFAGLKVALNQSDFFLNASFASIDLGIFTEIELNTLKKLIVTVKSWMEQKLEETAKMNLAVNPAFTSNDIIQKSSEIYRELQYLTTKLQIWKNTPKFDKPANDSAEQSSSDTKNQSSNESPSKNTTTSNEDIPQDIPKQDENGENSEKVEL